MHGHIFFKLGGSAVGLLVKYRICRTGTIRSKVKVNLMPLCVPLRLITH